ncbi:MAG: hypothetical protein K6G54_08295, partial [Oscillospiraceae bacterium]|nr:hypothetical protein [Oscillospiraceae bacterium]
MKAIILERRGEQAAVLCTDGSFRTERVSGEVGETVELTEKTVAFPRRRSWTRNAVAALLALTITGGTLGYMGGTASAYVSVDVDEDSAIELTINHFGRVIAVSALGEESEELARSVSGEVRNRRAEDAINITMECLQDKGLLGEEGETVIVGVATDNERRAEDLKQIVERTAERDGARPVYVSETSRAEREQAMERSVSVGRFGFERDRGAQPVPDGMEEPTATEPAEQPDEVPVTEEAEPRGFAPSQDAEPTPP